ncbi:hypothetical protein HPB48_022929 [Haemaphysalis longicornis]|uniref:Uncharacterized protein n=1 Tax=Haemaphysalis longicornis TaxID=44386 RepID=A0A9J6GCH4_HAELO|nr:hypothetical protein HPB48_022929 [Haemaphysalis longicornis]
MAGGHLVTNIGQCIVRRTIRRYSYVGDFIVVPECSRNVIIGMNFLQTNGAIIDLQTSIVTLSTERTTARND